MKRNKILIVVLMLMCISSAFADVDTRISSRWLGGSLIIYPPGDPGNAYLVDSSHDNASDDNPGLTWDAPLSTIKAAYDKCIDDEDSKVYVHQRHSETWDASSTLTSDIHKVHIKGIGPPREGPLITFSTGSVTVSSDNNVFENLRFTTSIDELKGAFNITGASHTTFKDCVFTDGTASNTLEWILSDASSTHVTVDGSQSIGITGTGSRTTSFIKFVGGSDHRILNTISYGEYGSGTVQATNGCSRLLVENCIIETASHTSVPIIGFDTDGETINTGGWIRNNLFVLGATETYNGLEETFVSGVGSFTFYENLGSSLRGGFQATIVTGSTTFY